MRKRYRKSYYNENKNSSTKAERKYLLRYENRTIEHLFYNKKYKRLSRLLYGKCSIFEGIIPVGWIERKDDLVIRVETNVTRKQIRHLNKIANDQNKELYVVFSWGPKGLATLVFSIVVEKVVETIIKEIIDYWKNKEVESIKVFKSEDKLNLEIYNDKDEYFQYQILASSKNEQNCIENKVVDALANKRIYIYDKHGKVIQEHHPRVNILA